MSQMDSIRYNDLYLVQCFLCVQQAAGSLLSDWRPNLPFQAYVKPTAPVTGTGAA